MFIRNIITTSALVVLLGLTGGPAFAADYPQGDGAFSDYDGSAVNEVFTETTGSFEDGDLPDQNS